MGRLWECEKKKDENSTAGNQVRALGHRGSDAGGGGAGDRSQLLINGAGATFPYPIYSKWFDEYSKVDPSVRFNYQSIGSGGGQKEMIEGTVDFGATDGPMSDENLAKAPGRILHVPTVAGADVVTYNLPGAPQLRAGRRGASRTSSSGESRKWNDPRLARQNPGVALPDCGHPGGASCRWQRHDLHFCRLSQQRQPRVGEASGARHGRQMAGRFGGQGQRGRDRTGQTDGGGHRLRGVGLCDPKPPAFRQRQKCGGQLRHPVHRLGHRRAGDGRPFRTIFAFRWSIRRGR